MTSTFWHLLWENITLEYSTDGSHFLYTTILLRINAEKVTSFPNFVDCTFNRVPSGFRESNSMIFPWFSMILSSFSMINATQKMMVSGISFYFSYCGLHITPFCHTFSTKYAHSAKHYWTMRVQLKKKIPWFFHRGILKFHDFSMILAYFFKFHDFSRSGKCFFHFPGFPWFSMTLGTLFK